LENLNYKHFTMKRKHFLKSVIGASAFLGIPFNSFSSDRDSIQELIDNNKKEFPILRKEYSNVIDKLLWEQDIDAYSSSSKSTSINFTGSLFAANKNKQDFQQQVSEILRMFRYKQSRYRWYKGEDTYTYYDMFDGEDSDIVNFK